MEEIVSRDRVWEMVPEKAVADELESIFPREQNL